MNPEAPDNERDGQMSAATDSGGLVNALTVDVEDYFQVAAFEKCVSPESWDGFPLRVEANTRRVLDLFDETGVKATFFVLGWVAERKPGLVREILSRGHELASHGHGHRRICFGDREEFRADVRRAKAVLEDASGVRVAGYRAPTYSITEKTFWALEVLVEEGYSFDSSIFPIRHDLYGIPGYERFPHRVDTPAGEIAEFPITTANVRLGWKRAVAPVAGGGYLRLFPVRWLKRALKDVNEKEGKPVVLYFHPWELDPGQPRIRNAPLKSRLRHYLNLSRTEGKLRSILSDLAFAPMSGVLARSLPAGKAAA